MNELDPEQAAADAEYWNLITRNYPDEVPAPPSGWLPGLLMVAWVVSLALFVAMLVSAWVPTIVGAAMVVTVVRLDPDDG